MSIVFWVRQIGLKNGVIKFFVSIKKYGVILTIKKILLKLGIKNQNGNNLFRNKIELDKLHFYNGTKNSTEIFAATKELMDINSYKGVIFVDCAFNSSLGMNPKSVALIQAFAKEGYLVCPIRSQKGIFFFIRQIGLKNCFIKFFASVKKQGFITALKQIPEKLNDYNQKDISWVSERVELNKFQFRSLAEIFSVIKGLADTNLYKGVVFIDCAFNFSLGRNQRPIALMQAFAKEGYLVCSIRYQWNKKDKSQDDYKCFYGKIFQIPMYDFVEALELGQLNFGKFNKVFIINIPDQNKLSMIPCLRENGFKICYDIMDHWQEFHSLDMLPWYKPEMEKFAILNSDVVTAVSPHLVDLFSTIRPINLLSNGVWGEYSLNSTTAANDNLYHVGYFGHLTEKWFNWDYILQLASDKNFVIHIIGEGAPLEILEKIKLLQNIRYYGYIPKTELLKHVTDFQVGLIPFSNSILSKSVDPLKVYEYLQYGLPVVATGIPHLNNYPYCKNVTTFTEFKSAIIEARQQFVAKQLLSEKIAEFLLEHQWDRKCLDLIKIINNANYMSSFYE